MDLERIAQEVTRELLAEMQTSQAHNSPLLPYKRILFVFNKADIPLNDLLNQLSHWKDKGKLSLVVPKWANSIWGLNKFTSKELDVDCISYTTSKHPAKDYVNQADTIVIIGSSRSFLSKVTQLKTSSFPAACVVHALSVNKPVILLDGELASSKSKEIEKLAAMGLQISDYSHLPRVFPIASPPAVPAASPLIQITPSSPVSNKPMPVDCKGCTKAGACVTACSDRIRTLMEHGAQRIGATLGLPTVPGDLAGMIDHTLLKAQSTEEQVRKLCAEAAKYGFASVCVNPSYVALCSQLLKDSKVKVCTVVGFPLGATDTETKANETATAVKNGADEIDMVINVGALKSKNYKFVEDDIRAVVKAASGKTVKVIFETVLLNDEEKIASCELSKRAGAHFVKTSTGMGGGGATEHDIALMRRCVGPSMGVKASGGVRSKEDAIKMVKAGATRIGASASIAIATGQKSKDKGY